MTSAWSMASWACRRIWERITSSEWGSMPPVSASMKVRLRHSHAAKIRSRVTPGVSLTMDSRCPMSLLNNVDFPTLGRPTTATTGRAIGITTYLFYFGYQNSASSRSAPSTGSISTRIDRACATSSGVASSRKQSPSRGACPGEGEECPPPGRAAVPLNPGRSADRPR